MTYSRRPTRPRPVATLAGGRPPRRRRPLPPLEKVEQQHAIRLLEFVGGKVYNLGTSRPRPNPECPVCLRNQTTRQTPGLADVEAWLPKLDELGRRTEARILLKYEAKAHGRGMSDEQVKYRALCEAAGVYHVAGPCNALIAWLLEHHYVTAAQLPHYRLPKDGPT